MREPLAVYLHDHFAGSSAAVEMLETLKARYPEHETGKLAAKLLQDIEADRQTLEGIIARVGTSGLDLKDATAWLAEKVSRIKLKHGHPTDLGVFEAMEALSLGIAGKKALWTTLGTIAPMDPRLAGLDFEALAIRAEGQQERLDQYRSQIAKSALTGAAA